jgi:hypothetical protein
VVRWRRRCRAGSTSSERAGTCCSCSYGCYAGRSGRVWCCHSSLSRPSAQATVAADAAALVRRQPPSEEAAAATAAYRG